MNKTVVIVVRKDRVGIIAGVCMYLVESQVDMLDITQTIIKEFFSTVVVADVESIIKSFGEVAQELEQVGEEIGVSVKIQREEIFLRMHRTWRHPQRIGRACNFRREGRKDYD